MSARRRAAVRYPGAISSLPSAPNENTRVTVERCRPPTRPPMRLSTATTDTSWPRAAAPSARSCTTRSMPPERGQ